MTITPHTFHVADFGLSALVARSAEPKARATVLALPGGGYTKAYWHNAWLPDQSLLALGPKLGFNVIALDRPGYGASAGLDPALLTWRHRARGRSPPARERTGFGRSPNRRSRKPP